MLNQFARENLRQELNERLQSGVPVKYYTHRTDRLGVLALKILRQYDCQTVLLDDTQTAPADGIVFFSHDFSEDTSKLTRMAGYKTIDDRPEWALNSPFTIALRDGGKNNFDEAILTGARRVEQWLVGGCTDLPKSFNRVDQNQEMINQWLRSVRDVFGGNQWGITPLLHPQKIKKEKAHGKGFKVSTGDYAKATDIPLPPETEEALRQKAMFVHRLGAFNFDVCLTMPAEKLHETYTKLVKRLALTAEAAETGAGEQFYQLVRGLNEEQLSNETVVMPQFEALLVYGKPYDQLGDREKKVCDMYQIANEQSHFSRIMDTNELLADIKRIVGTADAGDALVVRMMANAARYRKDL
ncbi:hypothetical protein HY041_03620, partial [Candidatus Roizmanbacteria bacterium]|nr:hypothetical protein [Candidatus Roizmanbacteria bacterium]